MLKHDLKAANIPYVDKHGLYADFHALRHTFITNMVKSGVNPKTAQSLARHSTIDLTMNVYTTLTVHEQASALASLPSVPAPKSPVTEAVTLRATGTAGPKKVPTMVPRGAEIGAIRLASDASRSASVCNEKGPKGENTRGMRDAENPVKNRVSCANPHQLASDFQAEREGFEPSVRLPPHWFSRPAHSAALSPLRDGQRTGHHTRRNRWFPEIEFAFDSPKGGILFHRAKLRQAARISMAKHRSS